MTDLTPLDLGIRSLLLTVRTAIPKVFRNRHIIVLIFSEILLVVSASFLFQGAIERTSWLYDDTEHLSIAYNLFHGKGLSRDFIDMGASSPESNIQNLMMYDQISNPLRSKAPLHLVLLGGWLYITGADYSNWLLWGSIFNLILAGISVVLFYLFTKRYFGFEVATYSTPVLALMPALVWYSVRIRPDLLAFIFIISALYFAARRITYTNIILVGLFTGMAHLAHPIGLLPGSALLVYFLLFKRNFKATLVLLATWALIISPWMVRNYIIFGDALQGLGIPIPRSISTTLGLIAPNTSTLNSADVGAMAGVPLSQTLIGMLDEFSRLYGMQFFMVFIACSVIAFLSFQAIKRKWSSSSTNSKAFFILSVALYLGVTAWAASSGDLIIQAIVFILIPLIAYLSIRLFSGHKDIFTNEGKEIYTILGIFAIVSFIPYLMYAQTTGRVVPEVRVLVFSLFLLIPLSIVGIRKMLLALYAGITSSPAIRNTFASLTIIAVLIIFCVTQVSAGIPSISSFQIQFAESEHMKVVHKWINENIPADAKVASNMPHAVLLRTGHEAVNFPTAFIGNETYGSWIIRKFDIDYLIFYGGVTNPPFHDFIVENKLESKPVFRLDEIHVYKIIELE
jgi:hypothetical protein